MAEPVRKKATYQDVLDAPGHMVAEVLDGELSLHPRPAKRHAIAASALGIDLGAAFQRGRGGPGGWVILDEPELHLGEDILVPDLATWRRERFPETAEDEPFFTVAPDWVCEVLSQNTSKRDRTQKLPRYAQAGVAHAWLVDPNLRTLECYALMSGRWTLLGTFADEAFVRIEPFAAIELELGALWKA